MKYGANRALRFRKYPYLRNKRNMNKFFWFWKCNFSQIFDLDIRSATNYCDYKPREVCFPSTETIKNTYHHKFNTLITCQIANMLICSR